MLGLPKETFVKIVTSEHAGANKPDPAGFQYIVDHYRDYSSSVYDPPARQEVLSATAGSNNTKFLMVGDRPLVDLAPAKALGMQTCLVWREKSRKKTSSIFPSSPSTTSQKYWKLVLKVRP